MNNLIIMVVDLDFTNFIVLLLSLEEDYLC